MTAAWPPTIPIGNNRLKVQIMTAFTITVQDQPVQALLQRMADKVQNAQPVLQDIGDNIIERTHRRFETSTGPDGAGWKARSDAAVAALATRIGSQKSKRKKDGTLNAAGQSNLQLRKLLIDHGMNGGLMGSFHAQATADHVTVSNSMKYAAIHQFGGKAGRGLKVEIPARPFLPVRQDGALYPQESTLIVDAINGFLADLQ